MVGAALLRPHEVTAAAPTTGYLASFVVSYQVEGVTAKQAAAVRAAVQRTLATNLPDLIGAAAEAPVQAQGQRLDWADRKVLAVRVEGGQHAPAEYRVRAAVAL